MHRALWYGVMRRAIMVMRQAIWGHDLGHTETRAHTHACAHTHTNKAHRAGVQLVGHTSIYLHLTYR